MNVDIEKVEKGSEIRWAVLLCNLGPSLNGADADADAFCRRLHPGVRG